MAWPQPNLDLFICIVIANPTIRHQLTHAGFHIYDFMFNGNWCWTSPTWSQVQFWSSWSSTRRSRVELQLDQNWTWVELHEVIHHRLRSSPSRPSWSPTRRSRVGLQLDRNWTSLELHEVIHHRLQSSPSRPNWSPTRRSRVGLQLGRDGLDWSCTRWTSVDSTQGHWVQVQVQRGAAELNLDLDEVALSWSCTRSSTSTLRTSPSWPSWSSTRKSQVELQLGRDRESSFLAKRTFFHFWKSWPQNKGYFFPKLKILTIGTGAQALDFAIKKNWSPTCVGLPFFTMEDFTSLKSEVNR